MKLQLTLLKPVKLKQEIEFCYLREKQGIELEGVFSRLLSGETKELWLSDQKTPVFVHQEGNLLYASIDGIQTVLDLTFSQTLFDSEEDLRIRSRMPGKVVQIRVKPGDEIKKNEALLILESMKMETRILAPMDGRIKAVYITEGQVLQADFLMLELE